MLSRSGVDEVTYKCILQERGDVMCAAQRGTLCKTGPRTGLRRRR